MVCKYDSSSIQLYRFFQEGTSGRKFMWRKEAKFFCKDSINLQNRKWLQIYIKKNTNLVYLQISSDIKSISIRKTRTTFGLNNSHLFSFSRSILHCNSYSKNQACPNNFNFIFDAGKTIILPDLNHVYKYRGSPDSTYFWGKARRVKKGVADRHAIYYNQNS